MGDFQTYLKCSGGKTKFSQYFPQQKVFERSRDIRSKGQKTTGADRVNSNTLVNYQSPSFKIYFTSIEPEIDVRKRCSEGL